MVAEELPVSRRPAGAVGPKRQVKRMRGQKGVRIAEAIAVITTPPVVPRIVDHAGPDRIEFDVTLTDQ